MATGKRQAVASTSSRTFHSTGQRFLMGAKYDFQPQPCYFPEILPVIGYYCIAQIKDDPSFATV